jgi:hypothetical protein
LSRGSWLAVQCSVGVSRPHVSQPSRLIGHNTYQNDKFNKSFATHQNTNGETFSPNKLVGSGGKRAADDLSRKCDGNNPDHIRPSNTIIQETEIGAQSRKCKIEWKEYDGHEIFDLFRELNCKATVVWTDKSNEESLVVR